MQQESSTGSRVDWVDYGKGLSILLVVLHHCIADPDKTASPFWSPAFFAFDEVFALFRMPLFFLMAGIFAAKSLRSPWPEFVDKKVIHFLYLFVLWSLIIYTCTIAIPYLLLGLRAARLDMILYIFVEPPRTLWFIYALLLMFLLTRLLRRVPLPALLCASLLLYFAVLEPGLHLEVPFLHKLVRLYFFFLLGCWLSPYLQQVPRFIRPWHALIAVAYGAFAVFVILNPHMQSVPIVLICELTGITAGIVLSEYMSRARLFYFLRVIGVYSLAVYVMHRLVLFGLEQVVKLLKGVPLPPAEVNILIALVLSITLPIFAAKLINRYRIHGILDAPSWMSVRRAPGAAAPRAGESTI